MKIGGFQKTSLIDYPNHIASVVWTSGCNFRCPFCYNRDLVLGTSPLISESTVFDHLKKRQGIIEGVVITGGEPLIHQDLAEFIQKIRDLGYLIKLDTNGSMSGELKSLLDKKLIDYVAMDIKAPKSKYQALSGINSINLKNIEKSIKIIQNQAPNYEFRTTVIPELLKKEDILEIAQWLKGSKRYILQQFQKPSPLIDKKLEKTDSYKDDFFKQLVDVLQGYFSECEIRGI